MAEIEDCKFEKPRVVLTGTDGNAYAIMAKIKKALMENGLQNKVKEFLDEATSGNYDHLIETCFKYADIE